MISDVCLVLEGTYPYVSGGVSAWVYDIIKKNPSTTFYILFIGAKKPIKKKLHFELPNNVVGFKEVYLYEYPEEKLSLHKLKHLTKGLSKKDFKSLKEILYSIRKNDISLFSSLLNIMRSKDAPTVQDLAYSYEAWKLIEKLYMEDDREISFIDYFWTWRLIYLPFINLIKTEIPLCKMYHAISTGYAGLIGSMAKTIHNRPFILTEHGIYTRERKIEIARSKWIYSELSDEIKIKDEAEEFFKDWWISLFSYFSTLTYAHADEIISLYEENREIQIEEGAEASKTKVIPNAIDFSFYDNITERKYPQKKYKVAMVARVVPIKDIKTFIRASKAVLEALDNVEIEIIGPMDEEPEYVEECYKLRRILNLEDKLIFTGKLNLKEYYPLIDLLVLTSISEAQPLVILEAYRYGIPVVSSNVGSCKSLLEGHSPEDRLLGKSGIITDICNAEETADAIIKIISNPTLHNNMSKIAIERVDRYYGYEYLIAQYRKIYDSYMEEQKWQV